LEAYPDFFKLAYIIEISVVLNLAFREIKYHNLVEDLNDEIAKIQQSITDKELTKSIYYRQLASLVNRKLAEEIKNSDYIKDAWNGHQLLEIFFERFLRGGWALKIVNALLIIIILLLMIITASNYYSFRDIGIDLNIENYRGTLWSFLYFFLVFSCIVPGAFMIATTQCHRFLFGSFKNDDSGKIEKLVRALNADRNVKNDTLNTTNNTAEAFVVPPEKHT